ncbi:MAG TPA: DUF1289 domain-containing protein [Alphaproteobacteria bacterium]|nr:DUF1289 domain-containing protein [Alphaproteobacteria bacterium]
MSSPPPLTAASPCIGVCRLDATTGWCRGCCRSPAEIAAWPDLDAATRAAILAQLAGRRAVPTADASPAWSVEIGVEKG